MKPENKLPPPPPPPGPRLIKHVPAELAAAGVCWILAAVIAVVFLGTGDRVTEYKCSAEQIEAMTVQLDLCDRIADGDMFRRRECYDAAQAAHCEVVREFHRTEIKRGE
jgi:hypothetical protein